MHHGESQGIRNANEAEHGEIAAATFNLTDVRRSQACPRSECLVGQTRLLPIVTQGRPKEGEQSRLVAWL